MTITDLSTNYIYWRQSQNVTHLTTRKPHIRLLRYWLLAHITTMYLKNHFLIICLISYLPFNAWFCFAVLCVCFCTGRFVMVFLNLTYLHCLQHSFFEHHLNLYKTNQLKICTKLFKSLLRFAGTSDFKLCVFIYFPDLWVY